MEECVDRPVLEPGQSAEVTCEFVVIPGTSRHLCGLLRKAGRLPRKTLSGYFIKTKESKESKEPAEQVESGIDREPVASLSLCAAHFCPIGLTSWFGCPTYSKLFCVLPCLQRDPA